MKSTPISSTLFIRNREKVVDMMGKDSVLLAGSMKQVIRNGDQFYPYRQHSDFVYLTGINWPECVLILSPNHPEPSLREIIFIRRSTPKTDLWTGPGLTSNDVTRLSGISEVKWLDELDHFMEKILKNAELLYTGGSMEKRSITDRYPDLEIHSAAPLIQPLRMVKDMLEVEQMKNAASITQSAFHKALRIIKPGVWEYEVEAEIVAEFIRCGAEGPAYETIVASGANAMILHYVQNHSRCREGDLVLMDFGAEVNNYAADCSRTVPVSGSYSPRQKEVYNAVLKIFNLAREMMFPGILISDLHKQVGELWEEEHIKLGLYSLAEARNKDNSEPLWKKYFMHGTSHSLGLDVHDTFDRSRPLETGMILTCEPAIYIPEEEIGIRLEGDIWITDSGPLDLLEQVPMEVEEIEEIMHSNQSI
jgi:Xaa-Pro aminopeptidase